jgi:UDP-N-acetylmuramoylalanine--D-glutamate ligase
MEDPAPDWLVIEVSSFQLETVREFRPDIAVLLNVLPNHLDRHGSLDVYRDTKLRLFENMGDGDIAFVPYSIMGELSGLPPQCRTFGTEARAEVCFCEGYIGDIDLGGTYFDNSVLGAAASAAVAICKAAGVEKAVIEKSARSFESLPHRMQTVGEVGGVRFINDSKATNLAAMCAALQIVSGKVHLIAGGRLKESDLSFAKDLLVKHVSHLYLIGEASDAMQTAWGESVNCTPCGTLKQAVLRAFNNAGQGDAVLLSPACTSFDQFRSFEERGMSFVQEVRHLEDSLKTES